MDYNGMSCRDSFHPITHTWASEWPSSILSILTSSIALEGTCAEPQGRQRLGGVAPSAEQRRAFLSLSRTILVVVLVANHVVATTATGAVAEEGLAEQYDSHASRLEQALANVRCDCTCEQRVEAREAGKEPQKKPVVTYTAELFGKREALEAVVKNRETEASAGGRELVVCYSQGECFQLDRPTPEVEFQVREHASSGAEAATVRKRARMQANEYVAAYLAAATRAFEIPIKKLLERPPRSVERIERDGRDYVRAVFGFPDGALYESCEVLLDPELEYAVKEYEYQFNSKPGVREWRRGAVDCKRLDNGFIVPAHVHLESGSDNGVSRVERRIDAALDNFTFGSVGDSQFSLAAFGLPDLSAPAAKRHYPFDRWYFWCLVGASLIAWFYLRKKAPVQKRA